MDSNILKNFATNLIGQNITIYEPENIRDLKYTNYHIFNGVLKPSTIYAICFDGIIQYTFKTTKKIDSFLKSFVNQHIKKYELKQYCILDDGTFGKPKKENVYKKFRDQNRVNKYFYYTTLYGIGMFAFFTSNIKEANKELTKYLNDNNIKFYNEFSEAGWAYRFVINDDVKKHNELLKNFKI